LQTLSERPDTAKYGEKEGDRIAVCDLADDLRDAIVEYQVSASIERRIQGSSPQRFTGGTAEGNLQAEL